MTGRRGMLQKVEEPIFVEQEILDAPSQTNTDLVERKNERNHQLAMKAIDSLPDLIGAFKDFMSIQKIKADTDGEVRKMDKAIEYFRAQTEDFVQKEMEKRKTFRDKSDFVERQFRVLISALNQSDFSDEIKKLLIDSFNNTVSTTWEGKS